MSRPVFGQALRRRPAESVMDPRLAIIRQCQSPSATRAARDAGEPTPCYRCLALGPAQRCHFTRS